MVTLLNELLLSLLYSFKKLSIFLMDLLSTLKLFIVNLSRVRGGQAFVEYAEAFKVEKILD